MKYETKISRLAVVCVMCATAVSGAFGAASVRSLGGAGTYSGTSSAASASGQSSGAINAVRAGSMRVNSSAGGTTASTSGTAARAATSQRLSIGKYLGSGTSVSGGSSIKNQKPGSVSSSGGSSMDPSVASDLEKRLTGLENSFDNVLSRVDDVSASLDDKLDSLTGDDYIDVRGGQITLNVGQLEKDIQVAAGADGKDGRDGKDVDIVTNGQGIFWQYSGEPSSAKLLATWETLRGPAGADGAAGTVDPAALNAAVAAAVAKIEYVSPSDLAEYAKTSDVEAVNTVLSQKADASELTKYATTESVTALGTALDGKADKSDLLTSQDVANGIATALRDYSTSTEISNTYATKEAVDKIAAGDIELTNYYTKAEVNTELGKISVPTKTSELTNDSGFLTEHQSLANYATTESVTALSSALDDKADQSDVDGINTTLAGVNTTLTNVNTSLDGKADKSELTEYATTESVTNTLADYATTESVTNTLADYATTESVTTALETKVDSDNLRQLAYKDQILNSDITEGTIEASSLSESVQTSLANADKALTKDGVPENGDYVLAVSDGEKSWFQVVAE